MIDILALHDAVYQALKDAGVAGGRVYDHAPQTALAFNERGADRNGAPLPYLELAESIDEEDDASGSPEHPSWGIKHSLTLRAWSRYRGQKELFDIGLEVRTVLHQKKLAVDGLASCLSYVEGTTYIDDPDGVTRQATIRVRLDCRT